MPEYARSIFLFHRDLRLHDNLGLIDACRRSAQVDACFIFEPRQIDPHPYRSLPALQFMLGCLDQLGKELQERGGRLHLLRGDTSSVVRTLLQATGADALFCNADYTPFARARDAELEALCHELGRRFHLSHDALLHAPGTLVTQAGTPYTVFTPFFKNASSLPVAEPLKHEYRNFSEAVAGSLVPVTGESILATTDRRQLAIDGGRNEARAIVKRLPNLAKYKQERDVLALDATTHLSAHLKFGSCSVREIYQAVSRKLGATHELVRQLYWRDFFTQVAFHWPHVFGRAFRQQYDTVVWETNEKLFDRWCTGTTGFPIVDAGMRELNQTGYMHNRARMITASFLVKDLQIDWRWGERYFATKLLDYDPSLNNGNWQWAASTGCDAQPYFRIFNPWTQQEKFDPDCRYVKRWIPELQQFSPSAIHGAAKKQLAGYPAPMVDHAEARVKTEAMYAVVRE